MEKITILNLIIPLTFLASIFMGPVFNFFLFMNRKILNAYWSFFINSFRFADVMAMTFVLFTFIFIISYHFSEKIPSKLVIILGDIIIGYCCIYSAFVWNWFTYALLFIVIGALFGLILPKYLEMLYKLSQSENKKIYHKLIFPISVIVWLIIQSIIFDMMGMQSWRILYLMIGIINIISAPLILLYKEF